ncbi:alpha/beta fold hydrolase [Deinococcus malanensis]|uniref:alpha/beta fold hydrolase n=1 Tax=Deinococcus malanensis TaxID=1706855 RepID=UPI001666A416|nr:alpha/beta hydrolase [Deinococcus malanensis]
MPPQLPSGASSAPPEFHGLVDVGGYRLNAKLSGQGRTTVVFESGGGSLLEGWASVEALIRPFARVVTYERAGVGNSDYPPSNYPGTSATGALRTLLLALGVSFPIVLVGHSLGDFFARGYAAHYPEDVAGLVLLDTRDARFYEQLSPHLPPKTDTESPGLARLRAITSFYVGGELREPAVRPGEDPGLWWTVYDLMRTLQERGDLGDRPLEVVVRGVDDLGDAMTRDLPAAAELAWRQVERQGWEAVKRLSSRGRMTVVEGCGHALPQERPDVVAQAIRRVVEAVGPHGTLH